MQPLEQGVQLGSEQLFAAHNRIFYDYDYYARQHGHLPPSSPHEYVRHLLRMAQVPEAIAATVTSAATERDRQQSLWTHTFDWVGRTLAALKEAGIEISWPAGGLCSVLPFTSLTNKTISS